ncbi:type II toxin-antitoxin system Phd/YefM family antitoxin [Bernardetia sp. ABR2-2B]|uniref:type II toxin-antitoxin system Phd/YefM family antitoxin n=1 Tax=Bernardetia sp. ABR2-2B TaxID=3127472 RepID=UPI0030CE1C20
MKVITLSELRKNMKKHFDEVTDSMETIAIPRSNKEEEAVIIMSLKEYNSLKETNYLLSTQTNRDRLNKSIEQMQTGKAVKFDI